MLTDFKKRSDLYDNIRREITEAVFVFADNSFVQTDFCVSPRFFPQCVQRLANRDRVFFYTIGLTYASTTRKM